MYNKLPLAEIRKGNQGEVGESLKKKKPVTDKMLSFLANLELNLMMSIIWQNKLGKGNFFMY